MADYTTISTFAEGEFKDRGSKFFAYAHPITAEEEAKSIVAKYKEEQPDGRHHCFAYRLGPKGEKYRSYDDGEPGGTAGKPILNQLLSQEVTNLIVVVVRYSSGTKLGVPGLINAYKEATIDALNESDKIEKDICDYYHIHFTYEQMPSVMKWTKQNPLKVLEQNFNLDCLMKIEIKKEDSSTILSNLPRGIKPKHLFTL